MQPKFQAFLGSLLDIDMVYRPCSGCVRATIGSQPDFQAFLGSFCARCARHVWARCAGLVRVTSWPWSYLGYVLAMTGTHTDFQAHEGHIRDASLPRQGRRQIFRHAKVARFAAHVRDAGTLPGILGSFWDTVCRSCPGRILVAIEKQPDF
ncbi:Hypothetical predicted protein [Olea europaea subsp. europaea]|uniref:Uncharacterized protein n=1 Tax=Olea europaea subsp. europaea TaxID=158383 RepID=A0A8S0UHK2_OLEEU|nr:Hypothetical predicted protein [Olea europaea subsp. europaea]